MKKLTQAERSALKKIGTKGGEAASAKLNKKQLRERARTAGIASGKARQKKAGKK